MMIVSKMQSMAFVILVLLSLNAIRGLQSAPSTRSSWERKIQKAADKLYNFSQHYSNFTLMIDGNNVRGMANFKWNPIELQTRLMFLCQEFGISRAVLVWDHGSYPFATTALSQRHNHETAVEMVVIFSGLSQRADDVIVKEARHLSSLPSKITEGGHSLQYSKVAVITNDGGLASRLRRQNHYGFASSRGKGANTTRIESSTIPVTIDSTRFVELLSRPTFSNSYLLEQQIVGLEDYTAILHEIDKAQKSLRQFCKVHQLAFNPRREKTWERCVLAETTRRAMSVEKGIGGGNFAKQYLLDLEGRGYSNPIKLVEQSYSRDNGNLSNMIITGPTRLDKRQKKLLARYNKARVKGELEG